MHLQRTGRGAQHVLQTRENTCEHNAIFHVILTKQDCCEITKAGLPHWPESREIWPDRMPTRLMLAFAMLMMSVFGNQPVSPKTCGHVCKTCCECDHGTPSPSPVIRRQCLHDCRQSLRKWPDWSPRECDQQCCSRTAAASALTNLERNMAQIEEHNAGNSSYTLGLNSYSNLSEKEWQVNVSWTKKNGF